MNPLSHEEQKKVLLDILIKIDTACKENNISYSLCFGSLLGAIRHNGFIPWDDDIDIALPRKDYEKLFQVLISGNIPGIKVVSFKNSSSYNYLFMKAYDTRTVISDEVGRTSDLKIGVYVDIFPIDGLGEGNLSKAYRAFRAKSFFRELIVAYNWRRYFRSQTHSLYIEPIRFLMFLLSRYLPIKKLLRNVDNFYSELSTRSSEYSAIVCGAYRTKEIMPSSIFSNFINVNFQGHSFMGFRDYDQYLTNLYGDYLKLPPMDKQVSHHSFSAFWID